MKRQRAYAELDRLTPEQVRAFKHEAAEPEVRARAAGAREGRVIVAHGDSWLDYPIGTDIVDCLRKFHGYSVRNHAQAGDTLENLVYGSRFSPMDGYGAIPSRFADVLDDLRSVRGRVLVFSGGGNDVAGEEFAQFLEHAEAGLGVFRRSHAKHVINVFFRRVLSDMIVRATEASARVQTFSHGYGYPTPDGRGIGLAIGLSFIGPWLRPALAAKRIDPLGDGLVIIRELIDLFNDMLASLDVEFENFHYIDLRPVIGRSAKAWANELHVRNSVYAAIAEQFEARMRESGVWEAAARPQRAGGARRDGPAKGRGSRKSTRRR